MSFKIEWATHESAKYACKNFHYSKCLPNGKLIKIGVWENDAFIGVIIFSRGANNNLGSPYNLKQTECCELTRVALTNHKAFVSEILSQSIKLLKRTFPEMKLIVSFADIEQNHKGGIYQATNWIYSGQTGGEKEFIINGKRTHSKSVHSKYKKGSQNVNWLRKNVDPFAREYITLGKHRYLMPLNKKIRKQIIKLHKDYPKNNKEEVD